MSCVNTWVSVSWNCGHASPAFHAQCTAKTSTANMQRQRGIKHAAQKTQRWCQMSRTSKSCEWRIALFLSGESVWRRPFCGNEYFDTYFDDSSFFDRTLNISVISCVSNCLKAKPVPCSISGITKKFFLIPPWTGERKTWDSSVTQKITSIQIQKRTWADHKLWITEIFRKIPSVENVEVLRTMLVRFISPLCSTFCFRKPKSSAIVTFARGSHMEEHLKYTIEKSSSREWHLSFRNR